MDLSLAQLSPVYHLVSGLNYPPPARRRRVKIGNTSFTWSDPWLGFHNRIMLALVEQCKSRERVNIGDVVEDGENLLPG